MLDKALKIAVTVHAGQKDKAGLPYIEHPLRVMAKMTTEVEKVVAILHDVVEDGGEDSFLKEAFPDEVTIAVYNLSLCKHETYDDYIKMLSSNALARKVKIADLEDNMDLKRLSILNPQERDFKRWWKYFKAWNFLKNKDDQ